MPVSGLTSPFASWRRLNSPCPSDRQKPCLSIGNGFVRDETAGDRLRRIEVDRFQFGSSLIRRFAERSPERRGGDLSKVFRQVHPV
jgi:hypothetical protein